MLPAKNNEIDSEFRIGTIANYKAGGAAVLAFRLMFIVRVLRIVMPSLFAIARTPETLRLNAAAIR